jgi:FMN-dependent NADH-azoreductase
MNNTSLNSLQSKIKSILLVQSSPRATESYSHQVAHAVLNDIKASNPEAQVVVRDLAANPPPHIGQTFVSGLFTQPEQYTLEQSNALALSDTLINEIVAADLLLLAVPVHNFGVPSTLKAWIDHVVRAGRTFSYSSSAPEGLLKGKRAIVVLASGGVFSAGPYKPYDFHEPYLRAVLGFIGITAIDIVRVEGIAVGTIGSEKAIASATAQSKRILAQAA